MGIKPTTKTKISSAITRRAELFDRYDCFRLFDGKGDGIENLVIDKLDRVAIVHSFGAISDPISIFSDPDYLRLFKVETIYHRNRPINSGNQEGATLTLLVGKSNPEFIINEQGLKLIIRPERALNGGIFLDTRDLRAKLSQSSNQKKVLNTFSYTGSLGLASYLGGAEEVVQVDSSKSTIGWAKENFEINRSPELGRVSFIVDDTLTFLKREVIRIENGKKSSYGIVILDPPTFGRSEKGSFKLEAALSDLIEFGFRILSEKGLLYLCVNNKNYSHPALEQKVCETLGKANYQIMESLFAPSIDFTTPCNDTSVFRGLIIGKNM